MTGEELIAKWTSTQGWVTPIHHQCARELAAALPEIERRARLETTMEAKRVLGTGIGNFKNWLDKRIAALTQPVPATQKMGMEQEFHQQMAENDIPQVPATEESTND